MKFSLRLLIMLSLLAWSCGKKQKEVAKIEEKKTLASVQTTAEIVADQQNYEAKLVIDGIEIPWGMTWLPDGSMLVTDRPGALYHVTNGKKTAIKNVPKVFAKNQGGLLDITLHPNYKENGWIYISYSVVTPKEKGSHTAIIRAKLENDALVSIEKLYQGSPNVRTAHHFGSRIVFDNDGYMFFSIGDRGKRDVNPQDITKDGGKIYRLHDDGRVPTDNPFVNEKNAKTAIFSYGHRNPQGMALHPKTGQIWVHEHGPRGGDEINPIKKGVNYGWPVITYGINYSGTTITEETARDGMEQPLYYWVPSIAPSGMAFVTSNVYPDLKNHLVVGSLKFQYLELLRLKNDKVVKREKLLEDIGRVRSVRQGPDGYVYVGIDGKGVYKMTPKANQKVTKKTKEVATTTLKEEQDIGFVAADQTKLEASKKRGAALYKTYCMQCHMDKGQGYARAFPPLAKSNWLKDNISGSIKSIKYGQSGKITVNGKVYNGVMTALGLKDKEVADVMNYILNEWGNSYEGMITPEQVAKVKK